MTGRVTKPGNIVLVVDDVPENLAMLYDALDEAGYTVLVATDGPSALQRARLSLPDVILLDAVMPGMDGFEVARQLKADFATQPIPIIFMTGLTETEHVVAAFAAGGADYVTKPLKPKEILVRLVTHVQSARQMQQARTALDAFGQATVAIDIKTGKLVWQTPLARQQLQFYFGEPQALAPVALRNWAGMAEQAKLQGRTVSPTVAEVHGRRLVASFHDDTGDDEWLLVLREEEDSNIVEQLVQLFRLTRREAEVLHWLSLGKTNRDIGDILGTSPRTINKHLEHIFEKLGVETRTAAASLVLARMK